MDARRIRPWNMQTHSLGTVHRRKCSAATSANTAGNGTKIASSSQAATAHNSAVQACICCLFRAVGSGHAATVQSCH
jgi:hypothetical protein